MDTNVSKDGKEYTSQIVKVQSIAFWVLIYDLKNQLQQCQLDKVAQEEFRLWIQRMVSSLNHTLNEWQKTVKAHSDMRQTSLKNQYMLNI